VLVAVCGVVFGGLVVDEASPVAAVVGEDVVVVAVGGDDGEFLAALCCKDIFEDFSVEARMISEFLQHGQL